MELIKFEVVEKCTSILKSNFNLGTFKYFFKTDIVDKRNKFCEKIKANIIAAGASGKDLKETGSEDDGLLDLSEDDFFLAGSSSDEADADDEWTENYERLKSARALMPPPRPSATHASSSSANVKLRFKGSSKVQRIEMSTSSNTSNSMGASSFRNRGSSDSRTGHSNLSSNSDARKQRRKRRPWKKKQQA